MRAVRGNKVYAIEESSKKRYQEEGFDIQDDSGNVILHGKGKNIPLDEHVKAIERIKELEEMVVELREENVKLSGDKKEEPETPPESTQEEKKLSKKPAEKGQ